MKTTSQKPSLPHESPIPFITDGGLKPRSSFTKNRTPCFAAFILLKDADGRELLRDYYRTYAQLAARFGAGFVLESPIGAPTPTGRRSSAIRQRNSRRRIATLFA
jgi:homocysteine S-methyltransferase